MFLKCPLGKLPSQFHTIGSVTCNWIEHYCHCLLCVNYIICCQMCNCWGWQGYSLRQESNYPDTKCNFINHLFSVLYLAAPLIIYSLFVIRDKTRVCNSCLFIFFVIICLLYIFNSKYFCLLLMWLTFPFYRHHLKI